MNLFPALTATNNPLQRIGFGHCGSVWGMAKLHRYGYYDVDVVIKREDASPGRDIKYEAMHQPYIFAAARSLQLTSVPQFFDLIDQEDDKRWHDLLLMLPAGLGKCRTMIAERITSVSRQAQLLLIEKYNWTPTRDRYIQDLSNGRYAHCLVHLYLGLRRTCDPDQPLQQPQHFRLRDFPLLADQMEELQLPCQEYAKAMAEALAMLHWQMRLCGTRVKFVLGARRGAVTVGIGAPLAEHSVWMLDFDLVGPIQANVSGLILIARAF